MDTGAVQREGRAECDVEASVGSAMEQLEKALGVLADRLGGLTSRLGPVLRRPERLGEAGDGVELRVARQAGSDLQERVRVAVGRLEESADRVLGLLEQLDL